MSNEGGKLQGIEATNAIADLKLNKLKKLLPLLSMGNAYTYTYIHTCLH